MGEIPAFTLNGRNYRLPSRPVAVVCIDGCDPAYIERGLADGTLPNLAHFAERGFSATARGVLPSFTNPNNVSIVTGAPPAVHGIPGNYFLDPATDSEVMMNDPSFLRSGTILAGFHALGARVAAVTAKDKLRRLLGVGLSGAVCFSSELADRATLAENGIEDVPRLVGRPLPSVYSADLSLFVLAAGARLLETARPRVLYLTLTDFIQHAHAPGDPAASAFYRDLDALLGRLSELGAVVAVTADHGMAEKCDEAGAPRVVWLQDRLDAAFGPGKTRVICPITDPYVAHHASLGGYASVTCRGAAPQDVREACAHLPGIEEALLRETACAALALPPDRTGDVIVLADARTVIGTIPSRHDISALSGRRLRSHGSRHETPVPFILSEPLAPEYAARAARGALRNFDIFDYAVNGAGA